MERQRSIEDKMTSPPPKTKTIGKIDKTNFEKKEEPEPARKARPVTVVGGGSLNPAKLAEFQRSEGAQGLFFFAYPPLSPISSLNDDSKDDL